MLLTQFFFCYYQGEAWTCADRERSAEVSPRAVEADCGYEQQWHGIDILPCPFLGADAGICHICTLYAEDEGGLATSEMFVHAIAVARQFWIALSPGTIASLCDVP